MPNYGGEGQGAGYGGTENNSTEDNSTEENSTFDSVVDAVTDAVTDAVDAVTDAVTDAVDDVSDFFGGEPDNIETSETVTDTYTSTASYNYDTDVTTVTVTDHLTGSTETTVTSMDMFGDYDIDTYSTTVDGSLETSLHSRNVGSSYEYSYDTHYHTETNTQYGYSAELYADTVEALGYEVDTDIAKGIEVAATVASIAMVGLPTLQTGMALASFGFGTIGYSVAALGAYSVYDGLNNLNDIFGGSTSVNLSISFSGDGEMGDSTRVGSLVKIANTDIVKTLALQNMAYRDVASRGIFEKMAGGIVYQGVFAGDKFFDATTAPNTNFSVGVPYSMSLHAKRIHSPYIDFEPKNQAGNNSFSVI